MDDQNTKNRRLNKTKLDDEVYKNLSKMLNATEEDRMVAYACLNTVNQTESLIYTLFLRKESKYLSEWVKNCPKVVSYHNSYGIAKDSNIITFPTIYSILKKVTKENKDEKILKFFLSKFASFIKESLMFDFIEDVEITYKLKDDEK